MMWKPPSTKIVVPVMPRLCGPQRNRQVSPTSSAVMLRTWLVPVLPAVLLRDFARRFAFAHLRIGTARVLDGFVAGLQIGGLVLLLSDDDEDVDLEADVEFGVTKAFLARVTIADVINDRVSGEEAGNAVRQINGHAVAAPPEHAP